MDIKMTGVKHRIVETNGIRMHVAEQGTGPLIVLCHGFPESWYSWRYQFEALVQAGFHVVAPDMRGYGQTDRPEEIDKYTLLHVVGDVVGLLDALGVETAVIAGHDWGAPVAWYAVAETEFERDVRSTIRKILYSASGDAPHREAGDSAAEAIVMVPRQGGFLGRMMDPGSLPSWLTEADVEFYVREFSRTGFRGGLNWYRNVDRSWEILAPFGGARVMVPALYVAGDRDLSVRYRGMDQLNPNLAKFVPQLRRTIMLPGCGHWTQQERAREVNAAMIGFLRSL